MSRRLYRPRAAERARRAPTASRSPWDAARSMRCESSGSSRTAGGRAARFAACYFELVTVDGASRVVFRDLESDRWYAQGGA